MRHRRRYVRVGDPWWDNRFVVKGRDPEAVRRFLSPERRSAIAAAHRRRLHWILDGTKLRRQSGSLVQDETLLLETVQQLVAIAGAVTEPSHG
jgi:hypothetical protein